METEASGSGRTALLETCIVWVVLFGFGGWCSGAPPVPFFPSKETLRQWCRWLCRLSLSYSNSHPRIWNFACLFWSPKWCSRWGRHHGTRPVGAALLGPWCPGSVGPPRQPPGLHPPMPTGAGDWTGVSCSAGPSPDRCPHSCLLGMSAVLSPGRRLVF